ncbi:BTB/POZ domain-containing protein DOT3 [Linum perenne]
MKKNRSLVNGGCSSIHGKKLNKCVIFPVKVNLVAEAIERRHHTWVVRTIEGVEPDLIIQVGGFYFHVHKLAMVSKSAYMNRLVFQQRTEKNNSIQRILIKNLPGGSETFELITKFCYGWKINLTPTNIAAIYSAANFLEMNNDMAEQDQGGNLISKAETFLTYLLMSSSWRDLFRIFESCRSIPYWARELGVLDRSSKALASRVCMEIEGCGRGANWWLEEVTSLRIDCFVRVVESMKREGMALESLKVAIEGLMRLLPEQETLVPCNILLPLLRLGTSVRANPELLMMIEARVVRKLGSCKVSDLFVRNSTGDFLYDVEIVVKVVRAYVPCVASNPTLGLLTVGRLVDEYLCVVSRDTMLSVNDFLSLVDALPGDGRCCHDRLYRAIDLYLKVHPWLTDEERTYLCRAMDYHKLSREAQSHATKNERLPLHMSTRIILLEQMKMTRSMTCSSISDHQRPKSQTTLKMTMSNNRSILEKGCIFSPRNEIRMMKKEVESMNMQINELQMCRFKMQQQLKRCLV